MKTATVSTIIAGLTAGAITLWYSNPVKKIRVKSLTKNVKPKKDVESSRENNDHLFI